VVRALQQVGGDVGEEPFYLVDPGRVGRREVHVESGVAGQPLLDAGVFVGAVVVADQVHVQLGRDLLVDLGQELLELDGAVPAVQA